MSDRQTVPKRTLTIRFGFDHVIHNRDRGWQDGRIYGDPVPGSIDHLRALVANPWYAVYISTLRLNLDEISSWLERHGVPAEADTDPARQFWRETDRVLVTGRVLTAQLKVETNAHEFTGDWDAVQERIDQLY